MDYRKANVHDIPTLVDFRKRQLVDEGIEPTIDIDTELYAFFTDKLCDGSLTQWLVEDSGAVIACGAMVIYDFPPSYTNKSGKRAYITNMYTDEEYRGQGIATQLLTRLVADAKESEVTKLWLGASKLGRPVYKKFGFVESPDWLEFELI